MLIGPEQAWQTSEEYLGTIADHLKKALALTGGPLRVACASTKSRITR